MEELTGKVEQGMIYGDNEAAMYLSKNEHVSARTKHIDIRSHYIRDHISESRAIIKAEGSEMNFSDILTKNTSVSIFKRLSNAMLRGFQGDEDKFIWKESINMITTNAANIKKNIQQKQSENSFEKNDLKEMENCYKEYKKRIEEDPHMKRVNTLESSKARCVLYGNETNKHAKLHMKKKLACDQNQRENVESNKQQKWNKNKTKGKKWKRR